MTWDEAPNCGSARAEGVAVGGGAGKQRPRQSLYMVLSYHFQRSSCLAREQCNHLCAESGWEDTLSKIKANGKTLDGRTHSVP